MSDTHLIIPFFEAVNGGLEMPNYGGIKVLRYISTYLILS